MSTNLKLLAFTNKVITTQVALFSAKVKVVKNETTQVSSSLLKKPTKEDYLVADFLRLDLTAVYCNYTKASASSFLQFFPSKIAILAGSL